jgi:hypothetical protein
VNLALFLLRINISASQLSRVALQKQLSECGMNALEDQMSTNDTISIKMKFNKIALQFQINLGDQFMEIEDYKKQSNEISSF